MKVGQLLRHNKKPEWGVGVVIATPDPTRYVVAFEGKGQVTLSPAASAPHLETVDPTTVAAGSPLLDAARWSEIGKPTTSKKTAGVGTVKCVDCGRPLKRSQYSADRRLKSCPKCSTKNGEHHVFLDYPEAFGVSEKRETEDAPDGAQSYCFACRTDANQNYDEHRCVDLNVMKGT